MIKWCDNEFSIEVNKICKSATAACTLRHGDTTILCSVSVGEWTGFDNFLHLTVDYLERGYSINRIPGGFAKREGKQKESEILISRTIDRSIRSTINPTFRYSINVSCMVLSYSKQCPVEPLCVVGASACLALAGVPCHQVAAVNISYNGGWKIGSGDKHNMTVSGNNYGVSCISSSGSPISPEVVVEGLGFASKQINPILDFVKSFVNQNNKSTQIWNAKPSEVRSVFIDGREMLDLHLKGDKFGLKSKKEAFVSQWTDRGLGEYKWNEACKSIIRSHISWYNKRLDGRGLDDIRPITADMNYIKAHGSCLFSRGNTSVLCVATISNSNESQLFETINGNQNRQFMLHYNYLNFGPDGRLSSVPSRRDIGHGELARSALERGFSENKVIRVVSDVLNSDGSSSMATVCGAYLALRSAGIRFSEHIAGISVGGITDGGAAKLFVDMTQLEDSISDFDLKIAGTRSGISAIQIDLDIPYLPWNIFEQAIIYGFKRLDRVLNTVQSIADKNQSKQDKNEPEEAKKPEPQVKQNDKKPDIQVKQIDKVEKKVVLTMREPAINSLKQDGVLNELITKTGVKIYIKGNTLHIIGETDELINNAISEVIPVAYKQKSKSNKIYYAVIGKIEDEIVELSLLDGTKFSLKKNNLPNDIKVGDPIVVSKGRAWSFASKF